MAPLRTWLTTGCLKHGADPRLADRSHPIVVTCILGPLGAIGGKLLHDMGFTDVQVLEDGVQAWIEAGLPLAEGESQ